MAMTSAEKIRALRGRMKAQGFTQRSIYLPKGETAPTAEEIAARLEARHSGKAGVGTAERQPQPIAPENALVNAKQTAAQKAAWQEELKQEELKAARAEGRKLARRKDTSRSNGYIDGICTVAAFFISKHRPDIAQSVLSYYYIDREKAAAVLEADKRTKSMTLATLDAGHAFDPPPPIMK